MSDPVHVLCINVGSSSTKVAQFSRDTSGRLVEVDRHNVDGSLHDLSEEILGGLKRIAPLRVAHRFVHGGDVFIQPVVIDEVVERQLRELVTLAPLHMPPALEALDRSRQLWPSARQIACFDTAFHRTNEKVTTTIPVGSIHNLKLRRYGFHGLSCTHVVDTLGAQTIGRCVIAHLGSGSSVTAVVDGRSVETSMGFTPMGGIPMATRSGDLDPGVLTYLLDQGVSLDRLKDVLTHESGLKAIGGAADMRELIKRASQDDAPARLAIDVFCHRVAQQIAAYVVTLGGLDTLVFTGGIGEHSIDIRNQIVAALAPLGSFTVRVVAADEELAMANQAMDL